MVGGCVGGKNTLENEKKYLLHHYWFIQQIWLFPKEREANERVKLPNICKRLLKSTPPEEETLILCNFSISSLARRAVKWKTETMLPACLRGDRAVCPLEDLVQRWLYVCIKTL
jgi:hypothetical protein